MNCRLTGNRSMRKVEPPIRSEEEIAEIHAGAWQSWLKTLTPDERAALENDPLMAAPEPPRRGRRAARVEPEEEELPLGLCDHVAADKIFQPDERLMKKEDEAALDLGKRRELILLGHVLPVIYDSRDARLEASIIALALKVGARQGITVGILADRHAQVKASIEERIRRWVIKLDVCRADLEMLRYVIAPVLSSRAPGLEAEVIAKAARIGLSNADTMEDVGAKHGVCRQSISVRVRKWCKKLGLPLPRECKQNTEAYRLYNVTKEVIEPFPEP